MKQVGGGETERLLETLSAAGRGVELARLARTLQTAPGQYRDAALATARALLAVSHYEPASPLDRNDRGPLFQRAGDVRRQQLRGQRRRSWCKRLEE